MGWCVQVKHQVGAALCGRGAAYLEHQKTGLLSLSSCVALSWTHSSHRGDFSHSDAQAAFLTIRSERVAMEPRHQDLLKVPK